MPVLPTRSAKTTVATICQRRSLVVGVKAIRSDFMRDGVQHNSSSSAHGRTRCRQLPRADEKTGYGFEAVTRWFSCVGRRGGIRTRDPLHPMQVRYQAALHAEATNYNPRNAGL